MKRECMTHKNTFANILPPKRLIEKVSSKCQSRTYTYGSRPFGVGVLVAFHDQDGPHLYEINPAGESYEYYVSRG
jgi:20S proteasome subunit alpha 6